MKYHIICTGDRNDIVYFAKSTEAKLIFTPYIEKAKPFNSQDIAECILESIVVNNIPKDRNPRVIGVDEPKKQHGKIIICSIPEHEQKKQEPIKKASAPVPSSLFHEHQDQIPARSTTPGQLSLF